MSGPLLDTTADALRRRVGEAQASWPAPSVAAAVSRRGSRVFEHAVGLADADTGARTDGDTQLRIGSITKTFTAVMVMALRDEGRLRLDEPVAAVLPASRHGGLTPRQLLSHQSGLQREPVGDVWWTLDVPTRDELLAGLEEADTVSGPHRRFHYSNLAYAVLGEVVARLDGRAWEESLRVRLLEPLGLTRTAVEPTPPRALGYQADPYADRLLREPDFPIGALGPAAQLWSTPRDLVRWGGFLADPGSAPDVLSGDTLEEMAEPQVTHDVDAWTLAYGLGLMLLRDGDRILVGHEGAMPGFLASVWARRPERVAAAVLTNTGTRAAPGALAAGLVTALLDAEPDPPEEWAPGTPVDPAAEPLLGTWWSEGTEFVFSWRAGHLEARVAAAPAGRPPAVFAPEGDDLWRTQSGREAGELLRVVRRSDRSVARLHWATYGFTRDHRVFQAPGPHDGT